MKSNSIENLAIGLGNVAFDLIASCQEKENRFSKQLGISRSEFRCLRCFQGEEHINIKVILKRLSLSGSRLTRILDGLENNGIIVRAFDPQDRRSSTVTLTAKGKELVLRIEERYIKMHREILLDVPEEMHEPLVRGMMQLTKSLDAWLRNK